MSATIQRAAFSGALIVVITAASSLLAAALAQEAAPRSLPPQVQADVEAMSRNLLSIQDEAPELACPKAVENARYGLETMLEVGQRNRDGGYIDAAKFDETAQAIRTELVRITPADCEAAQGGRLAFYRCMSSDYNHVMACAALDK